MAATSRATPIIDRQRAMFGSTSTSMMMSPMKSASGIPTGASSSRMMMPSCSSADAELQQRTDHGIGRDAANLGRLEFLHIFFRGMAVEENGAGQGENDLLSLVARLDVRGPGDELLDLLPSPQVTVGKLSRSALGWRSTLENLGDDDLVAVPDGAAILRLDAQALGDGQAERRAPRPLPARRRSAVRRAGRAEE